MSQYYLVIIKVSIGIKISQAKKDINMTSNSRQPRHQSVISRQSEADNNDDHWLKQFENTLHKNSVQPRSNIYEEISSIMNNTKSKFHSVQEKVNEMLDRSGMQQYLSNVKTSEPETKQPKKTAQDHATKQEHKTQKEDTTPNVIKQCEKVLRTLENIISGTKGNTPISAIIARLRSLHNHDVSDDGSWDDEKLIRLVSKMNLQAKKDNPASYDNFDQLGQRDYSSADSEIDPSNTDAFHALQPAKI
jgi:hypothetical protein